LSQGVACEGAPRDLGHDQGRARRAELRRRFGELPLWRRAALRAGLADPATRRLLREVGRHFPHQAETLDGLALGAGVPAAWLAGELAAELRHEAAAPPLACARCGPDAAVARALDGAWLVRSTRPEGLFAALELTRPWLGGALLGVNERGLAVAVVGGEEPARGAPAALLAQDCLERFEALDAALEWCEGRPGEGRALLLMADAHGDAAGIDVDGERRRVLRPDQGLVVGGGVAGAAAELAKALGERPPATAEELARALPGGGAVALAGEPRLWAGGRLFTL
jgi:hypothetical protein